MNEIEKLENYLYMENNFRNVCVSFKIKISLFNKLIFLSNYYNTRYNTRKIIVIFNNIKSQYKVTNDFKDYNIMMTNKYKYFSYNNVIFISKSIYDIEKLRGEIVKHIIYYNDEYNGIDEDGYNAFFNSWIRPTLINCIEENVFL